MTSSYTFFTITILQYNFFSNSSLFLNLRFCIKNSYSTTSTYGVYFMNSMKKKLFLSLNIWYFVYNKFSMRTSKLQHTITNVVMLVKKKKSLLLILFHWLTFSLHVLKLSFQYYTSMCQLSNLDLCCRNFNCWCKVFHLFDRLLLHILFSRINIM